MSSAWFTVLLAIASSVATCSFFLGRLTGRVDKAEKDVGETAAKVFSRLDKIEKEYVTVLVCDAHKQHMCQLVVDIKGVLAETDKKLDAIVALNGRVTEFMDEYQRQRAVRDAEAVAARRNGG